MAAEKCDVMVSYVHTDLALTEYLVSKLRENGISVWYPSAESREDKDSSRQRAQAVVNCKVFILVVSEQSVVDQVCRDELSLAYISNSSIFPVSTKYFRPIAPYLDAAMKLILAKINWSFFVKPEDMDNNIMPVIERIREDIQIHEKTNTDAGNDDDDEPGNTKRVELVLNRQHTITELDTPDTNSHPDQVQFWQKHFTVRTEVSWKEFKECFLSDYGNQLKEDFGEEKLKWFQTLLYKDIFEYKNTLLKETFVNFIGKGRCEKDCDKFYTRLTEYATDRLAMREVFNMDSTVRLTAIQNLGSYQTPSVVAALFNLLEDSDPNVRAVAVLALVKTGRKTSAIANKLIEMLEDEDRLVRESCCLSLAHMKAMQAVPYITNVWRNEPIKNVREAAELALKRIGGDEAEQAVKLTTVLSSEMASLRISNN